MHYKRKSSYSTNLQIANQFCKASPNPKILLDADYWNELARAEISKSEKIYEKLNTRKARNVIIFVGDGMSLVTVTASRLYKSHKEGKANIEASLLFFETFPHVGLSKVTNGIMLFGS